MHLDNDIAVYDNSPERYLEFQKLRVDYVPAIESSLKLATDFLNGQRDVAVVDFCSGPGVIARCSRNEWGLRN